MKRYRILGREYKCSLAEFVPQVSSSSPLIEIKDLPIIERNLYSNPAISDLQYWTIILTQAPTLTTLLSFIPRIIDIDLASLNKH
jgi:hypothetical protein